MKNLTSLLKRRPYIPIMLLLLLYLVVNASMADRALGTRRSQDGHRKEQIRQESLKVQNKTTGITVVSMEMVGDSLNLKLRNDYGKIVTSYELGIGAVTIHTECLTGADHNDVFLPGTERIEYSSVQPDMDKLGVRVLAAIFEDGSADGDQQYVREMREYRKGMRMQRERSVVLLSTLVNLDSDQIQTALGNFETESPPVSEEQQKQLPYFVRRGLGDERDRFIRLARGLKGIYAKGSKESQTESEDPSNKKTRILKVIENYTSTIRQL